MKLSGDRSKLITLIEKQFPDCLPLYITKKNLQVSSVKYNQKSIH